MKLTLKQLQADIQEQLELMTMRVQRSENNHNELHERADRILLNLERFKQEVKDEFADVRAEMRSGFADVRAEMRSEFARLDERITHLNSSFSDFTKTLGTYIAQLDQLLLSHDERITSLEKRE